MGLSGLRVERGMIGLTIAQTVALASALVLAFALGAYFAAHRVPTSTGGMLRDDATGKISSAKVFAAGTWLATTVVFMRVCWAASPGEGVAILMFAYQGLWVVNGIGSKLIGARWGGKADEKAVAA